MTYRELAEFIMKKLDDEQKEKDSFIYDSHVDEFFPVHFSVIEESNGVLSDNHPYFIF